MIKIMMTVRNRFELTKKSIEGLYKHTKHKFQLYVYDNLTDYRVKDHYEFFHKLYEKGLISQITFNTKESTFDAFSKSIASNQFGYNHLMDPQKNKYPFLLILDNDMIVTPEWDKYILMAWRDIKKYKLNNIKIIGQNPGGIKYATKCEHRIAGVSSKIGKLGGSGFWAIRNNFFDEIGFLPIENFVGINKKHDQYYWKKLDSYNKGKPYILGLDHTLAIHTGSSFGSVCNKLTKDKNSDISFKEQEEKLSKLSFDEFYSKVVKNKKMKNDW